MITKDLDNLSVIETLEFILEKAFNLNASDIHIDPTEKFVRLRFRIDGILKDFYKLAKEKHEGLISRIKILTGLRVDEHSKAQDGRFRFNLPSENFIDIRVSILPTYFGENAVLRILSDQNESFGLDNLGFSLSDLEKIRKFSAKSSGMILVTGPTGSGKTTTLYSIIRELNKEKDSIITIEDPIEYAISGVRQVQVDKNGNLNFANGLKSVLRQDPNIIMVGEIRDVETAMMAVNTALTGHLLLSTLHTSDSSSSLARLIDMKIEPFILASTFSIAINQRLVRKICNKCKEQRDLGDEELLRFEEIFEDFLPSKFFVGRGCQSCKNSGYKGRTVLAEVLNMSDDLHDLILNKASGREIKQKMLVEDKNTLMTDGLRKVESGITTLEEVLRVSHE